MVKKPTCASSLSRTKSMMPFRFPRTRSSSCPCGRTRGKPSGYVLKIQIPSSLEWSPDQQALVFHCFQRMRGLRSEAERIKLVKKALLQWKAWSILKSTSIEMEQMWLGYALNVINMAFEPRFPIPAARKHLECLWVIAFVPLLNQMIECIEYAATVKPSPESRVSLVNIFMRVPNYKKWHIYVPKYCVQKVLWA